jgi:hypothetical protein
MIRIRIRFGLAHWIRIRIEIKSWVRIQIRTEPIANPQHWFNKRKKFKIRGILVILTMLLYCEHSLV